MKNKMMILLTAIIILVGTVLIPNGGPKEPDPETGSVPTIIKQV